MEELLYSALDLAAIIISLDLRCHEQALFLEQIWENERSFLRPVYRDNKRKLVVEVMYWLTYLSDKETIDKEFPMIQKDALMAGGKLFEKQYIGNTADLDLFFKCSFTDSLWNGQ